MWTWPRRLERLTQQCPKAQRRSATNRTKMMRDPTAMPMIVPVDSCVGLEGWSTFGDRATRPGELAAEPGEFVPVVKSNGIAVEVVVVVVAGRDSEDAVTVCCATVVFGPKC